MIMRVALTNACTPMWAAPIDAARTLSQRALCTWPSCRCAPFCDVRGEPHRETTRPPSPLHVLRPQLDKAAIAAPPHACPSRHAPCPVQSLRIRHTKKVIHSRAATRLRAAAASTVQLPASRSMAASCRPRRPRACAGARGRPRGTTRPWCSRRRPRGG